MGTRIDRLEKLAADPHVVPPRVWSGFNLVTENAWTRDYVVAALRAIPDLVKLAHAADQILLASATSVGIEDWHVEQLREAWRPLFTTEQS